MIDKDIFKGLYDDFFGVDKIKRENEKLKEELNIKEEDVPFIDVESQKEKGLKDKQMVEFYNKLEQLFLTEESKNTIKKIIEYMRKYNEKIEKEYIPFNLCIYSDNKETIYGVIDILSDAATFFGYIKVGKTVEASFYNIEKAEQIEEIYNAENSVIHLTDFEVFNMQESKYKDAFLHKLEDKIIEKPNQFLTIISAKDKKIIDQVFEVNNNLKEKLFNFEIYGVKPDVQDVYQEVLKKLKENSNVTEESTVKLLDYITTTYPNTQLSYPEYRDGLCKKILFNKKDEITVEDIPKYEKEKTIDEIFEELNSLVGLDKVKKVLKDLVSLMELKKKTNGDLKIGNVNLHMVFLGNPGTGKTTVARIVAQILYNLKYIKQNKLIEVSSKDLVAEYVGQTAPKTNAVIEKAMGGVLFIDEAYSLASGTGQGNSYNEEAIATLIQAMENYRDNLVVIFAGYTKEMQNFLNSNSGIVSRIGYTLEFEDYTSQELLQIFESMIKKAGFSITKGALDEALKIIDENKNIKNFGNARFVRNLYEKVIIKHAANTKGEKGKKALKTIVKEDIGLA